MFFLPLCLIPPTLGLGWYLGFNYRAKKREKNEKTLSRQYFVGLNYLLNEQQDKAVDIFIKMLEVDTDTVETHLALGSLFRRRGEVDRAIRIHQNLIARPQLEQEERFQALLELGRDYMRAGVLDRAECLFLEVVESGQHELTGLCYLLEIYEQEKEWAKAIVVAKQIANVTGESRKNVIAHYHCELAEEARQLAAPEQAYAYLKRAISIDKHCMRASKIYAELEFHHGRYRSAIRFYKLAIRQDVDFISELILPLEQCYQRYDDVSAFVEYLRCALEEYPRILLVLTLSKYCTYLGGHTDPVEFIIDSLRKNPSIRGLQRVVELYLQYSPEAPDPKLQTLFELTQRLLIDKPVYRCQHCGFSGQALHWQCPSCKHWSTVKPIHGIEGD